MTATLVAATGAALAGWFSLRPSPVLPPRQGNSAAPVLVWCVLGAAAWVLLGRVALLAVVLAWAGRHLAAVRARRRARATTATGVLETCELLAADLAGGRSPAASLSAAAEVWPELRPVAEASALGGDVPAAMRQLADRPGAGELRLVAAAWAVSHRTGAGLAAALDRVASSIRADRATQRVVEGELASARATARLVAALPLLVQLLGLGNGQPPWSFLLHTSVGLACLAGGIGLGFLGLWWIERIADEVSG